MEVWLTGTPAELDAAETALRDIAYVAFTSVRYPMAGVDAGRYRTYLRLAVPTTPVAAPRPASAPEPGGALIDLDDARARSRPA